MANRARSGRTKSTTLIISRLEALESRCLLSATLSPDMVLSPDRGGHWGGGWGGGGYGGGGYGGGGNGGSGSSGGSQSTVTYYVPPDGYTPAQIDQAYGFGQVTDNGAGTTIAIVDAYYDPNISSDLTTFDKEFDLPAPPSFTQVDQNGNNASDLATNNGWALETSLDVEWAHAAAPGANILLVEAKNDNTNVLLNAVNYARNAPGVVAVSMSWGGGEFSNEEAFDSYFTTPTGHTGETFVASAGDSPGAQWPASSPNVLSVGGTTLYSTNSTGTYGEELGWDDSGGGLSQVEPEPSYQGSAQTTGARSTPDVAYDADPNTGFQVYDSVTYGGVKGWQEIGGTSAGAPQWAGLIADADQARSADNLAPLSGVSNTLSMLYGTYGAPGSTAYSTYASVFHDITTGGGYFFSSGATPGYDLVTGLGSPNVPQVINLLTNSPVTVTASSTPKVNVAKPHTPIDRFVSQSVPPSQQNSTAPQPPAQSAAAPAEVIVDPAPGQSTSAFSDHQLTGYGEARMSIAAGSPVAEISNLLRGQLPSATGATLSTAARNITTAATGVANLTETEFTKAATQTQAVLQSVASPHVALQLAELDASIFADSLSAFAKESASLTAATMNKGWAGAAGTIVAALLADAVLVGYWYQNRSRRKSRSPVLAAPEPE
ncbi:MAG: S53 family peptidase [Tepidisphaeraceae bacterium]